ncbi:MAG: LPS-assembly protein LptD [Rhodoferax sp.]|uniref:LPS-assembly protein LptD n=1 Tax=Rhodoferax sp. TaxID=50421 RepID=UPI002720C095|nr:LPS-assembly protein LptD [Rhodoferax sp.]MDO8448649.1 LPS-assembly protein LptD [Rhodoferax sp.]
MHDLTHRVPHFRYARSPVALVAWALLQATSLGAQEVSAAADEAPLFLKSSPLLDEQISPSSRSALPTFIIGDRLYGRPDLETVVEGDAVLRRGDMVIKADRLEYYQPDDLAKALGNVHINRAGNVYEGSLLELKLDTFEGFFNETSYHFLNNDAHGEADRVDFIDDKRAVIRNATYTTCRRLPGPSWMPDWILRANTIRMDNEEDVGTAQGALLSFKGVPLLPIPYITFPLSDRRKSGFMPPTLGLDNVNGAEVSVPYYWNIAPNRDATFTPSVMSKRGVNLASEFRYLEADYAGQMRLDLMPSDQLRERNRWGLSYAHQGTLKNRLTDNGLALNLNLNRVSDDNYWRDFSRTGASLTQRLLANDASLSWTNGYFASSVRMLKWQTLQDPAAPIAQPYDLAPQLTTRYARSTANGIDYSVVADYSRFQADSLLSAQPNANGQRAYSLLQVSRPWMAPAGFITPKLQLHVSNYQLDAPLANGANSASRVVPTFSLDSGLVFERDASYFGRAFRQTLEPRAFYVNTPYRDQSLLPVYDTGANDFNFATIYTENAFVGNDRISDSNLLTLGVTTRLLDPDTGAEAARFGVAQRLRFKDQNVTLPGGAPVVDRISDVLLGASVNWNPKWAFDSTVQFNPKTEQSVRATIGARYSPGNYRVVSAAYRYQRDLSEQLDVGWQWPVNDLWGDRGQELGAGRGQGEGRWYSVGRLNYSLNEGRLVDAVIGFEYDAGCWLGRAVLERLQTSTSSATQRIMFQLEFVGFTRLGVNPLKTLKENIPNYQYLREQTSAPSRFSNYD